MGWTGLGCAAAVLVLGSVLVLGMTGVLGSEVLWLTVYTNLSTAQLGGIPGTYNLVRYIL